MSTESELIFLFSRFEFGKIFERYLRWNGGIKKIAAISLRLFLPHSGLMLGCIIIHKSDEEKNSVSSHVLPGVEQTSGRRIYGEV